MLGTDQQKAPPREGADGADQALGVRRGAATVQRSDIIQSEREQARQSTPSEPRGLRRDPC